MISEKIKRNLLVSTLTLTLTVGFVLNHVNAATTVESNVQQLLNTALSQKTFYAYNMAYTAIMGIEEENIRNQYLSKLAILTSQVLTPTINNFTIKLSQLCATPNGRLYDQIMADVSKSTLTQIDKGYLLGELTGWGRELVFTPDYTKALDSSAIAWNKMDKASYDTAYTDIQNVSNKASRDYLLDELIPVKKVVYPDASNTTTHEVDIIKEIKALQDNKSLSRQDRVVKMAELAYKDTGLDIPNEVITTPAIYEITDRLMVFPINSSTSLSNIQFSINNSIAMNESQKLIFWFGNRRGYISRNDTSSDIDITKDVLATSTPLLSVTKIEILDTGTKYPNGTFIPNYYTYMKDGKIFLKSNSSMVNNSQDRINIRVTYKTGGTSTNLYIPLK